MDDLNRFTSRLFQRGFKVTDEYRQDLACLLSLGKDKAVRLASYIASVRDGESSKDDEFMLRQLEIDDETKRSRIRSITGFHLRSLLQNEAEGPREVEDLRALGVIDNDQASLLTDYLQALLPALPRLRRVGNESKYAKAHARAFDGVSTACRLAVRFSKDFLVREGQEDDSYDADADFAGLVPVASIAVYTKQWQETSVLEFQVTRAELHSLLRVLRMTANQLDMLTARFDKNDYPSL